MTRGHARAAAISAVAAWAMAASCATDPPTPTGSGGVPVVTGGHGGTPSTTKSTASGGAGARGGAGGAGGAVPVGPEPIWAPFATLLGNCKLERLQNRGKVRAFRWVPCAEGDCEQSLFDPWLASARTTLSDAAFGHGFVQESETGILAALNFITNDGDMTVFVDGPGNVLDAFRMTYAPGKCLMGANAVWSTRYGTDVVLDNIQHPRAGGVLHALDAPGDPKVFEVPQAPFGYGPSPDRLGESRWLWWYFPSKVFGLSAVDGSDLRPIAEATDQGPVLDVRGMVSTGPTFLLSQVNLVSPTETVGFIAVTDGIEPSKPYLMPPAGSYFGGITFAHSHIAWFRGIGQKDIGLFDKIEIWTSVYDADPGKLVPFKVADYPSVHVPGIEMGGHGWAAQLTDYGKITMWNLATKATRIAVLPGNHNMYSPLGITKTHLWVATEPGHPKPADLFMRFKLVL